MKNFITRYFWHLILWISFMAYEIIPLITVHNIPVNYQNYFVHYCINISFSYLLSELILPFTFGRDKRKPIALIVFLAFSLILFLMASNLADKLLGYVKDANFFGSAGLDEIFITATIWRSVTFMGIGTIIFLFRNRTIILREASSMKLQATKSALNESELALELAIARNAYLQAQVNPHFMLSSLSYIYDNTRKSAPDIAETVHCLSKLLRYGLSSERGPEKIEIHTEIKQVENLFKITKIKGEDVHIIFRYSGKIIEVKVIPFVLLSLAENMLKHGDLSNQNIPAMLTISQKGDMIVIDTQNLKSTGINDTGFHTGLSNIEKRLMNAYQNRAKLTFEVNEDNLFLASVFIPLEY